MCVLIVIFVLCWSVKLDMRFVCSHLLVCQHHEGFKKHILLLGMESSVGSTPSHLLY